MKAGAGGEPAETAKPLGGSYGELTDRHAGTLRAGGKEVHHIPSFDSTGLAERLGPAIVMDKADHKKLNSTGSSDSAGAWRQDVGEMVAKGRSKDAIDTEMAEIQTRFGDKYDEHLRQMLDHAEKNGYYTNDRRR